MQSNDLEAADVAFRKALALSPELNGKINCFKQSMGDEFLSFVEHFKTLPNRETSIKYLLKKGLKICPGHEALSSELTYYLKNDLDLFEKQIDQNLQTDADSVTAWYDEFIQNPVLFAKMSSGLMGRLHKDMGKLSARKKDYGQAIECFRKALEFLPQDMSLHSDLIDTYFLVQDFHSGISALNAAVNLDKNLAAYWDTIGDSLRHSNQFDDALIAYENCFTHLPEKIELLKKIGDCYFEIGELEAAKTAYEQYKLALEKK